MSAIKNIITGPKIPSPVPPPPPPPPPPVPTKEESAVDIAEAQKKTKLRQAAQGGRARTILTSGRGVIGDDSSGVATKTLLGG